MRSPLRGFPQKSRSGDRPGDGDFHSLSAYGPFGGLCGGVGALAALGSPQTRAEAERGKCCWNGVRAPQCPTFPVFVCLIVRLSQDMADCLRW